MRVYTFTTTNIGGHIYTMPVECKNCEVLFDEPDCAKLGGIRFHITRDYIHTAQLWLSKSGGVYTLYRMANGRMYELYASISRNRLDAVRQGLR